MSSVASVERPRAGLDRQPQSRRRRRRNAGLALVWAVVLGNAAAIVWLWVHGGRLSGDLSLDSTGTVVLSLARITGLLGAYLALIEVVLLARLPRVERLVGFDRLTVWHRWNGHACLYLVVGHTFLSIWGYQLTELQPTSYRAETARLIWGDVLPGMVTATIGTALLVLVVLTSVAITRRRLSYELWYAVHLAAYAGIALGWFHQIPTGNDLVHIAPAEWYWRSLYVATLLAIAWRVAAPLVNAFRHRLRVEAVTVEAPGVVSLRIAGRKLGALDARPGQFFLWRFLAPGLWSTAHPFSLSAAPDGRSLRITAKALGDHTRRLGGIAPGTRVVAEGPFGTFTEASRTREKLLLVAGGIGITPIRALVEELDGDVVVIYRAATPGDVVFADELAEIAARRGIAIHTVVGDHATPGGAALLSPSHLRELVPDVAEREAFLCGPPALVDGLRDRLREAGISRRHLHIERFAL